MIYNIPELEQKKKIRLKRDENRISCFESNMRMAMVGGSQDGTIQIISDPSIY